jgi:hypothetical protein
MRHYAALALLISGALLAVSPVASDAAIPVAGFQLDPNPTCPIGGSNAINRVGNACVDESDLLGGIAAWNSITDGSVRWDYPGAGEGSPQWSATYDWAVPATIPFEGAFMDVTVIGQEKTGNPNASICPAMAVGQEFTVTPSGTYEVCAHSSNMEGEPGPTASVTKQLKLVPQPSSGTAILLVGIQDGMNFYYQYSYGNPPPPPPAPSKKAQTKISYTLAGHFHKPKRKGPYDSVSLRGKGSFNIAGSSKVSEAAGSDSQGKLLIEVQRKTGSPSLTAQLKPVRAEYIREVGSDRTITYTIRFVYQVVASPLGCMPVGSEQVIVAEHHKGGDTLRFSLCGTNQRVYESRSQAVSLKQSAT